MNIQLEFEKMYIPLNTAISHAEKLKTNLLSDQISRQTKIWEFTIKPKPKQIEQTQGVVKKEVPKTHFVIGNPKIPNYDHGDQISLEKPLHFILGDTSSIDSNSSYHSSSQSPVKTSLQNINESVEPELKNEDKKDTNNLNVSKENITPNFQIGGLTSISLNVNNLPNPNPPLHNENVINKTKLEEKIEKPIPVCKENSNNENKNIKTESNGNKIINKNDVNNHTENIIPNLEIKFSLNENNKNTDDKISIENNQNIEKPNLKIISDISSLTLFPNFQIGAPAMDIINDNKTLRYE